MSQLKNNLFLKTFALKIPMLFFVSPKVIKMNEQETIVKIPLNWKTKNHLGSMYFGVLAVGADAVGGLAAMKQIKLSGKKVHLSFKNFKADFLKRPEADTLFVNTQGQEIRDFVTKVIKNPGERMNFPLEILATCPSKLGEEPVARFELTLSLKSR